MCTWLYVHCRTALCDVRVVLIAIEANYLLWSGWCLIWTECCGDSPMFADLSSGVTVHYCCRFEHAPNCQHSQSPRLNRWRLVLQKDLINLPTQNCQDEPTGASTIFQNWMSVFFLSRSSSVRDRLHDRLLLNCCLKSVVVITRAWRHCVLCASN